MGLSTERKVFVGILCVAGAALIIDQGLLQPSSASGALPEPGVDASQATIAQVAGQPTKSAQNAAQLLIDRLKVREGEVTQADISLGASFSLDQLIEPVLESVTDQQEAIAPRQPALPVVQRISADLPTLTAVMPAQGGGGGAVLNGKLVRLGQTGPNGYVLMQVRKRGVVLERDGQLHSVEIPIHHRP